MKEDLSWQKLDFKLKTYFLPGDKNTRIYHDKNY